LQAEKQSGRETSLGETNGHKSGGLVSVLASGPSAHPKNARYLTLPNKHEALSLNPPVPPKKERETKVSDDILLLFLILGDKHPVFHC
jgi:hypothetical protein